MAAWVGGPAGSNRTASSDGGKRPGLKPHEDLLAEFPFLGPAESLTPKLRDLRCVTPSGAGGSRGTRVDGTGQVDVRVPLGRGALNSDRGDTLSECEDHVEAAHGACSATLCVPGHTAGLSRRRELQTPPSRSAALAWRCLNWILMRHW
jgi:hypothetical protein